MATEPSTPNPPDGAILAAIAELRADLIDHVTDLRTDLTTLRDDLTAQIAQMRVNLSTRMDAHGNRLTAIQEEIGVALAGTEHGVRLNTNTREEHLALTREVTALTRLVRTMGARLDALEDKPGDAS